VGLGVSIDRYVEQVGEYPGSDAVTMNMSMTANSRIGIEYTYDIEGLSWVWESSLDYWTIKKFYSTDFDDDDDEVWVDFPSGLKFRFYGGLGSAEYDGVWICTNGYLCLDDRSRSTSPTPQHIPNVDAPNGIVAAVWTDLEMDADSTIITGLFNPYPYTPYFVVTYQGFLHKVSQTRLTFQIRLGNLPYPDIMAEEALFQSEIWISYNGVDSITTAFTRGIENQQGGKGLGGLYDGGNLQSLDGKSLHYYQSSSIFFLDKLTLTFEDAADARFQIREDASLLRGNNILPFVEDPDPTRMYASALWGGASLLITAINPEVGVVLAGQLMIESIFFGLDMVDILAYHQHGGRQANILDLDDENQQHWAEAQAWTVEYAVDAEFCIVVDWILDDDLNDQYHDLTITATLDYVECIPPYYDFVVKSIDTTVSLEVGPDDNNDWDLADSIEKGTYSWLYADVENDQEDYYIISVLQEQALGVKMIVPPNPNFDLYLYNSTGGLIDSSASPDAGMDEYVFAVGGQDARYIKVVAQAGDGFYSLEITLAQAVDVVEDGKVDIQDIARAAKAFGTIPGDPRWDRRVDITGDEAWIPNGIADIKDIATIAKHFDEVYPYDPPDSIPQGTTCLKTDPEEITVSKHEAFSINVDVYNITDLYAYQFKLYYDTAILNCSAVDLPSGHFLEPNNPDYITIVKLEYNDTYNSTHGRVSTAVTLMADEPGKNGSGTLATINFTATAPGSSALEFEDVKLVNTSIELIPRTLINGSVTVLPTLTVLAEDQYNTSLNDADVYIDGELVGYTGSTLNISSGTHQVFLNDFWETGNTGYRYSFTHWEDNSTTNPRNLTITTDTTITAHFNKKWCPGDVNGDGKVDIADVSFVAIRFGTIRGESTWDSRADLNRDNKIDIADIAIVSQNFGNTYT
jgi:hypothetical protein